MVGMFFDMGIEISVYIGQVEFIVEWEEYMGDSQIIEEKVEYGLYICYIYCFYYVWYGYKGYF